MNEAKSALRREVLSKCAKVPQAQLQAASENIAAQVLAEVAATKAKSVFCYVSYRQEIQTHRLLHRLHEAGCRVYVPRIREGQMEAVRWQPQSEMLPNRWGIPEPARGQVLSEPLDLCLLPGVAFSKTGARLGYGGGYYDRFLAKTPCIRVGICGSWQLTEHIPLEAHDLPLHKILWEK